MRSEREIKLELVVKAQAELLERAKEMIDYEERVSGCVGREEKKWLSDLAKFQSEEVGEKL